VTWTRDTRVRGNHLNIPVSSKTSKMSWYRGCMMESSVISSITSLSLLLLLDWRNDAFLSHSKATLRMQSDSGINKLPQWKWKIWGLRAQHSTKAKIWPVKKSIWMGMIWPPDHFSGPKFTRIFSPKCLSDFGYLYLFRDIHGYMEVIQNRAKFCMSLVPHFFCGRGRALNNTV